MFARRSSSLLDDRLLFLTIKRDDLNKFKSLFAYDEGLLLTWKSYSGNSVLFLAVLYKSWNIFNYLLTLDVNNTLINSSNDCGKYPLGLAMELQLKRFVAKLIEKKGEIRFSRSWSPLHTAISREWFDISDALIKGGANLNALDRNGETPLYIACKRGLTEQVFKLLSLGADPFISNSDKWSCADELALSENKQMQEFFFNSLLNRSVAVHIHVFTRMMQEDSVKFLKLLETIENIKGDYSDLELHFIANIAFFKPEYFRMFVDKFDWILKSIIDSSCLSKFCQIAFPQPLNPVSKNRDLERYLENIGYILNNPLHSPTPDDHGIVRSIIESFESVHSSSACVGECFLTEDDLGKIIYFFLTYGINPHFRDLDAIYKHFGYCDLFKRLLHMGIEGVDFHNEDMLPMPRLIYDMDLTIEEYVNHPLMYHTNTFDHVNSLFCLQHFSALPRVVYRDWLSGYEKFALIFGKLPDVPSLVELARNRSRDYIIDKFQVRNSRQFYTILQRLPIADVYKQIIAFEKKIYCV